MARDDDADALARDHLPRWRERAGPLRDSFNDAAKSNDGGDNGSDSEDLSIKNVKKRAFHMRENLDAHIERHRPLWEAREEQRLRRQNPEQRHFSLESGPKPPPGAPTSADIRNDLIRETARRNVERRIEERRERINIAERRMIREFSRDHDRTRSR